MTKKHLPLIIIGSCAILAAAGLASTSLVFTACNGGGSAAPASDGGGGGGGSSCTGSALSATVTEGASNSGASGGTCKLLTRDTTSCQSARTALGLSGNWLKFSCNVTLGLANGSGTAVTNIGSATYVTATSTDLPDHHSNYFTTTGTYSFTANSASVCGNYTDMHETYTPSYNDPNMIASQSLVMYFPLTTVNPSTTGGATMGMGMVGMAVDGVAIYNNLAANTDNIFAEAGSFDNCEGHPSAENGGTYHYHSEPTSISYDDNNVIGIMRDGYWIYGRKDFTGSSPLRPGSIAAVGTSTSGDMYVYGGHAGADPITGTGSTFHYHLSEWKGCYDQTGGTHNSTDGATYDDNNTPNTGTVTCGGSWVDAWFLTGHGNGGVFNTVPSGIGTQAPSQTATGTRKYYGRAPAFCTNC